MCTVCRCTMVQTQNTTKSPFWRRLIRCRAKTIFTIVIMRFVTLSLRVHLLMEYSCGKHFGWVVCIFLFNFFHAQRIRILCNMQYHQDLKERAPAPEILVIFSSEWFGIKYLSSFFFSCSWMHSTLFHKYLHRIFVALGCIESYNFIDYFWYNGSMMIRLLYF